MNQKQLEIFSCLTKTLNFTKAADLLSLSQTTVTFQIRSLEEELGVELFERKKRSVSLTAAGASFAPYAERILSLMRQAADNALAFSYGYSGSLKAGIAVEANTAGISNLLSSFTQDHPNIRLTINGSYPDTLINDLLNDDCDLIFTPSFKRLITENIKVYRIGQYKQIAAFHKDHPFSRKSSLKYENFRGEKFISVSSQDKELDFTEEFIRNLNKKDIHPEIYAQTDNIDSVFMMLEANLGVTVVPEYFSSRLTGSDTIKTCDIDEDLRGAILLAAWKADNQSEILKQFLLYMKDHFQ